LEVDGAGQAAQGVAVESVVGPDPTLFAVQQSGLDQLLEMVLTVGWLSPSGPVNAHTQTGSGLVASRLMILTR